MADRDDRRKSCCSDEDCCAFVPEDYSEEWLMEASGGLKKKKKSNLETFASPSINDPLNLRMFVGTWNVGGKSPHHDLNLNDWLSSPSPAADIYVLGFQEIVPLNAGNVLGLEDKIPAAKWLSLISRTLNQTTQNTPEHSQYYTNATEEELKKHPSSLIKPRFSFSDLISLEDELNNDDFERFYRLNSNFNEECSPSPHCMSMRQPSPKNSHRQKYCLVAKKQMVGIFLCVWVRVDLNWHISNLNISCVGRGVMGYLGNKGSISISMTLYQTRLCFVCTHLTSGEKEENQVRRNLDVFEILKRTKFHHSSTRVLNILDHDKVIWLGDLNYRLTSGHDDTIKLLKQNDWQTLLEKDQLGIEQRAGRVFKGWEEGKIDFAPTYKYITNSDHYVVHSKSKQKKRTPAWCDRILWKGEGLTQLWYRRGESKFSDHRPVDSLFSVRIDLSNKKLATKRTNSCSKAKSSSNIGLSIPNLSKVQAEELLLLTKVQSCIELDYKPTNREVTHLV